LRSGGGEEEGGGGGGGGTAYIKPNNRHLTGREKLEPNLSGFKIQDSRSRKNILNPNPLDLES
jgi:hypothetical protein